MENGWSLNTLERYLSEKISHVQEHFDARFQQNDRSVETALAAMDRRLAALNEFRASLADQRLADEKARAHTEESFLTKELYEVNHKALEDQLDKQNTRLTELDKKFFALSELKVDKREGLSSRYMMSVMIFSALSFVASAISILWNLFSRGKL